MKHILHDTLTRPFLINRSKVLNVSYRLVFPIAVLVMIAFNLIRDIPWDDEAGYHLSGLLALSGKVPDGFLVYSPLYSILAGLFDTLFGVEYGIRITWIVGAITLIASSAMVLYELDVPKGHKFAVLCLLTASSVSISWVGVSRAGITFVLLAILVALRFPRRYWSSLAILSLVILGSLCRLDIVLSAPPLILLWGCKTPQQQLGRDQIKSIYRWAIFIVTLLLVMGILIYTSKARTERGWVAFRQHYTVLNENRLPVGANPWFDTKLIESDFPGATSVIQAWDINSKLVIGFYLKTVLRTCWASVAAVAPRSFRLWFLPWGLIAGMVVTLRIDGTSCRSLARRAWTIISQAPSSYIFIALIFASASSFLVVAETRHVVGLVVAVLLFSALLAQHPGRLTRALIISSIGFWIMGAFGSALFEATKPRLNTIFVKAATNIAAQTGRPLSVIDSDSNLLCMYLGNHCTDFSFSHEVDRCIDFRKPGDLIVIPRNQRKQLEQCAQGWHLAPSIYQPSYDLWVRTQNSSGP